MSGEDYEDEMCGGDDDYDNQMDFDDYEDEQRGTSSGKKEKNAEIENKGLTSVAETETGESILLGERVKTEEKAYELYNDYAFVAGFGTRKHNYRKSYGTGAIKGREFVCCKQGKKKGTGVDKQYTKLDVRTGCKAMIFFEKTEDGEWEVTKHNSVHNHSMCPADKVQLLKSHRNLDKNHLRMLQEMVESGISIIDAYRFLKGQAGGSSAVGFTKKDAYNKLATEKMKFIDGCDAKTLINIFTKRRENEYDFYFAFELDEEARLVSIFWRDKRMKHDYILFGKLLIHDTTYRTNKYKLICAPFVGMNHHAKNCMFACGFILNERVESFVWIFNQFLQSMDGMMPETIMTDQAYSMAAAIREVFPNAKHKLCTWHILKNSKKNIPHLTKKPEFELLFNQVLMYCDTIDEFQHFWDRMVTEYDCATHPWIVNLYKTREKWCSAFTKDRFSGGILSSQRSESTNNSVSRRLHKTASLHEFYKCFCQVIAEWRSNEKHEDKRCWEGYPQIAVPNLQILTHASQVYTIEAFNILQANFLSGMTCKYKPHECNDILFSFIVWKPTSELFAHVVCFNLQSKKITCTCKQFHEVGILCCQALRIYFHMCIEEIPEKYILTRWTRAVIKPATDDDEVISSRSRTSVSESSTLWTVALQRNWNRLINTSSSNLEARRVCKDTYENAKKEIEEKLGLITIGEDVVTSPNQQGIQIRNPKGVWTPGRRNKRTKGTREKIDNRVRTRQRIVTNYKQRVSSPAFINSTATSNALDD